MPKIEWIVRGLSADHSVRDTDARKDCVIFYRVRHRIPMIITCFFVSIHSPGSNRSLSMKKAARSQWFRSSLSLRERESN